MSAICWYCGDRPGGCRDECPATKWNPRYLAYCREHGRDPDAQLVHDDVEFPGGSMCGFILWLSGKWREWRTGIGVGPYTPLTAEQTAAFDYWLNGRGWAL